jgi:hypothetical protein
MPAQSPPYGGGTISMPSQNSSWVLIPLVDLRLLELQPQLSLLSARPTKSNTGAKDGEGLGKHLSN